MILTKKIYEIDYDKRFLAIKLKDKIKYFYLQKSLIKKFGMYLEINNYISFSYDDKTKIIDGIKTYQITQFFKILSPQRKTKRNIYYDLNIIQSGIKDFLSNCRNVLCLDLEMTMIDYGSNSHFIPEIIQAGLVLCNPLNEIILEKSFHIKPTKIKKINKRTLNFSHIKQEDLDQAIPYKNFYLAFKEILDAYDPLVVVWGKNDIISLNDSYQINNVRPLLMTFTNLMQVHKNFYNLKQDPGLFTTYKAYTNEELIQKHQAIDDAIILFKIYQELKNVANDEKKPPNF